MDTILVPLDGSPLAEAATTPAVFLAGRTGARLRLLAVHRPPSPPPGLFSTARGGPQSVEAGQAILRGYLDALKDRLQDQSATPVDAEVQHGVPVERIAAAARNGVGLVVLASHGRGGSSRMWLGSVTDTLVRQLSIPILVVRPPANGGAPADAASFRRVLIPLDGAPETEAILETALRIVGTDGVEYILVRVCTPLHPLLMAVASRAEIERDTAGERAIAADYLGRVAERLRARGATVTTEVRFSLEPAREILAAATERGATLVALATHGRGPLGRFMLGSVGDKVLRGATGPVLIQRVAESPPG